MRILVKFLLILVVFSSIAIANNDFGESLYKEQLQKYIRQSQWNEAVLRSIKKHMNKEKKKARWSNALDKYTKQLNDINSAIETFKKSYKNDPLKVVKKLYLQKKKDLVSSIDEREKSLEFLKKQKNSSLYKRFVQHAKQSKKNYEDKLQKLESEYTTYVAKSSSTQIQSDSVLTSKNSKNTNTHLIKTHISTDIKTSNIQTKGSLDIGHMKVADGSNVKDSTINSKVKTKNIKVSKDGNTTLGSVTIGH